MRDANSYRLEQHVAEAKNHVSKFPSCERLDSLSPAFLQPIFQPIQAKRLHLESRTSPMPTKLAGLLGLSDWNAPREFRGRHGRHAVDEVASAPDANANRSDMTIQWHLALAVDMLSPFQILLGQTRDEQRVEALEAFPHGVKPSQRVDLQLKFVKKNNRSHLRW